jgi:hypothetical protein
MRDENTELRELCRQARLQCRITAERSAIRRPEDSRTRAESREIARLIAQTLSELGLSAFVFEQPVDTAHHLF